MKRRSIKLLILDVDGTLTSGEIFLGARGEEMKAFHVHDGLGIKLAQKKRITVALITGRESQIVENRAKELQIEEVYQGCKDKVEILNLLVERYSLYLSQVAYIGDDINDLPAMERVGVAIAVKNAVLAVKEVAHYITEKRGGEGAVREAIEYILDRST